MTEPTSNVLLERFNQSDAETTELILHHENSHSHGTQILKCLDAMRRERQLCDVILTVEGHELFAHRALLSCYSKYFLELFLENEANESMKKQVYYQMDQVEYVPLKLIVQFVYQGRFRFNVDLVPKLYLTAYQLRIESIFKACSIYLSQQLTEQNCLSTRLLAMDDDLRNKATECIKENFIAVLNTREFHMIPTLKLELIDSAQFKSKILFDLVFKWINQQLGKNNQTLQELCNFMHLLYLNGENLQDCEDMDDKDVHFSDLIKDYQSYRLRKRNLSSGSTSNPKNEDLIFDRATFPFFNYQISSNLYTPETKLVYQSQSNDHTLIGIAIVKGKMLIISIQISVPTSNSTTPEQETVGSVEKSSNDYFTNHLNTPILTIEKDLPIASLEIPRCCFGIASINDVIYVIGGYNRIDCLDKVEKFDPIEGKWSSMAASLTSRRGRVSATIVQDQIYVCGGSDGQKELSTGESLPLGSTEKWLNIQSLSSPVAHSAMCSDEQFVYLIGGIEGDKCKNNCYRYDPKENQWSRLPSMNTERSQAGAVCFQGKIYVFGGSTSTRCLASCEIFDLSTNQWINAPNMKEMRRGCGVVEYHQLIFVIGGSNGVTTLSTMEIFDPKSDQWLKTTNGFVQELNVPRVGLGVTVCCDRIYAIGGFDGRTFLKSVEVFDNQNKKWSLNHSSTMKLDLNPQHSE